MKPSLADLIRLMPVVLFASCAAPKAVQVEETITPAVIEEPTPAAIEVKTAEPDDGLRLPDYVTMPGEANLKRGPVVRPPTDVPAPVISRPPLEPPSRRENTPEP